MREFLVEWIRKGVLIYRLKPDDGLAKGALGKAAGAMFVGLMGTVIIEYLVLLRSYPKTPFDNLLGIPASFFIHAFGALVFTLLLLLLLYVARARCDFSAAAALTCYTLSGLMPILMLANVETLAEALKLFALYRDPSLPYLSAATLNLLFPEQAGALTIFGAWGCFIGEMLVFIYFMILRLRRLLIGSCRATGAMPRATICLLGAVLVHALFVRTYYERWFWGIIAATVGGVK